MDAWKEMTPSLLGIQRKSIFYVSDQERPLEEKRFLGILKHCLITIPLFGNVD